MSINLRSLLEQRLFPSRKWRDYILEEEKIRLQNRLQRPDVVQRIEEKVSEFTLTRKKKYENFILINKVTLLNIADTRGLVRQILIMSQSNQFKVRIAVDGKDVIYEDFDTLAVRSPYTDVYDAFQDAETNEYVFVTGQIGFREKCTIELYGNNIRINFAEVVYNVVKRERKLLK